MLDSEFCNPITLTPGAAVLVKFGAMDLALRRVGPDWLYAIKHLEPNRPGNSIDRDWKPEGHWDWIRVGCGQGDPVLQLRPALPDRALVVRPEAGFRIPPGERIQFFVSVPLWLQVLLCGKGDVVCADVPSVVLSNTWFGSLSSGELGYALRTRARRAADQFEILPGAALSPVRVRNNSSKVLEFERLCIRVPGFSLFRGSANFWTNELSVSYRGDGQDERVVQGLLAPSAESGAALACPARVNVKRGLLVKSLQTVASLVEISAG